MKKLKRQSKESYYKQLKIELEKMNKKELDMIYNGFIQIFAIGLKYRDYKYLSSTPHNIITDIALIVSNTLKEKES